MLATNMQYGRWFSIAFHKEVLFQVDRILVLFLSAVEHSANRVVNFNQSFMASLDQVPTLGAKAESEFKLKNFTIDTRIRTRDLAVGKLTLLPLRQPTRLIVLL